MSNTHQDSNLAKITEAIEEGLKDSSPDNAEGYTDNNGVCVKFDDQTAGVQKDVINGAVRYRLVEDRTNFERVRLTDNFMDNSKN